jgi:hypothetical protein
MLPPPGGGSKIQPVGSKVKRACRREGLRVDEGFLRRDRRDSARAEEQVASSAETIAPALDAA